MTATLQQPGPFAVEVQRTYLHDRHGQKILVEVRRLLVVALHSLWRQLLIDVLGEELFKEHQECFRWSSSDPSACFFEVQLLEFFCPPTSLGILGLTFGCEAGIKNSPAIPSS
jgi:hypothetical protein